jgi:uncharacterized protein YqiB (DUF1249 family)
MQSKNYSLACLHRECELNYRRLMRLNTESLGLGNYFCIQNNLYKLEFNVVDTAKFTTTLFVAIAVVNPKWLPNIELKVRVYQDAKMAEVIEWCSDSTIPWDLVERKGQQSRDEKWQWNSFLGELLWQCLTQTALEAESR